MWRQGSVACNCLRKQVALFGTKQHKTAHGKKPLHFFGCPTAVIRWSSELRLGVWVKPTVKKGDQHFVDPPFNLSETNSDTLLSTKTAQFWSGV